LPHSRSETPTDACLKHRFVFPLVRHISITQTHRNPMPPSPKTRDGRLARKTVPLNTTKRVTDTRRGLILWENLRARTLVQGVVFGALWVSRRVLPCVAPPPTSMPIPSAFRTIPGRASTNPCTLLILGINFKVSVSLQNTLGLMFD